MRGSHAATTPQMCASGETFQACCMSSSSCSLARRILLNYAVFNPDMGYCQGMSDLVAPLLTEIQDESDTFWCFVGLMENTIFISSPRDEDMERQLVGSFSVASVVLNLQGFFLVYSVISPRLVLNYICYVHKHTFSACAQTVAMGKTQHCITAIM